jgi:hypothetical protein
MGWREYTIAQEMNFDHDEVCDQCGATYHVILRAQGRGSSSIEPWARRMASDILTMEVRNTLRSWHRCTHCGRYSGRHIETMKAAYRPYRFNRRVTVGCCVFGAILFGSLPVNKGLGGKCPNGRIGLILIGCRLPCVRLGFPSHGALAVRPDCGIS